MAWRPIPGRLFQPWVEMRPKIPDQAQHDRGVVKDMGHQDGGQGVGKLDRRGREVENSHQDLVHPAAAAQQGIKGRRHNQGRHHKGDSGQGPQQPLSTEFIAPEQVGARQPDQQGEQGGQPGLPEGEPLPCARGAASVEQRDPNPVLGPAQTHRKDAPQRIEEEHPQKNERQQPEQVCQRIS